jgi:hypothetical protein
MSRPVPTDGKWESGPGRWPQKLPFAREAPNDLYVNVPDIPNGTEPWKLDPRGRTMDPVDGPHLGSQLRHVRCRINP